MDNFKDTLLDIRDDILDFVDDYRKQLIIVTSIIAVLLIVILFVCILYSPQKLTIINADSELGDIVATKAKELTLQGQLVERKSLVETSFEWEVSDGKLEYNSDDTVTWTLPVDEGTYYITVKANGKETTKSVTIIGNELSELYANSSYEIIVQDTDGDGLTDLYEASNSRTSQTSVDTDGDGLYDGDEIIMGLDPLSEDSKGDGLKDGERKLEYTFESDNVVMEMVGIGNFTQTSVDKYSTETLDNVNSIVDGLYAFYTEVELDSAQITIKYNKSDVTELGITESNLAVYELNEDENTFQKIRTTVDTANSTLTFTTDTLGKYFIADSSQLTSNLATDIVFLIDNSGSMYDPEEVDGGESNDVNFKRVDVVNDLIDKLQGNYKFGVGKFTFDYTELATLSSDKTQVKNYVTSIKTSTEVFSGTYIGAALEGGLEQFSEEKDQNRRYIILISDGADTSNVEGYDDELLETQIEVAVEKGVKIYVVGLGGTIETETLSDIAEQTGGKYYFASTDEDLEIVFDLIAADLNYNLYDTDNDDVDDCVLLADSGFLVQRDGFSFSNFANTQVEYGYGYGMVLYAKMFYEGTLPSSVDSRKVTTSDGETIVAPPSNPTAFIDSTVTSLRTYTPLSLTVLADLPADFWSSSVSKNTLAISSTYRSSLVSLGFSIFYASIDNEDAPFSSYESISFDMTDYLDEEEPENEVLEDEDVELLRTLARFDIAKYRDEKFYFYDSNDTAFETLKTYLENGEPVMIRINDDYTVLAVKLLAYSKNLNKYKIEVYDPNYASVPKYIEVERYKFSDIAEISNVVTDEYEYKFSYQGVDIGICLSIPHLVDVQ